MNALKSLKNAVFKPYSTRIHCVFDPYIHAARTERALSATFDAKRRLVEQVPLLVRDREAGFTTAKVNAHQALSDFAEIEASENNRNGREARLGYNLWPGAHDLFSCDWSSTNLG